MYPSMLRHCSAEQGWDSTSPLRVGLQGMDLVHQEDSADPGVYDTPYTVHELCMLKLGLGKIHNIQHWNTLVTDCTWLSCEDLTREPFLQADGPGPFTVSVRL